MIEAIIARPDSQAAAVDKLVRYCDQLDGTKVRAINIPKALDDAYLRKHPNAPFPCIQANGLRRCAEVMRGKPFFWLEPDSVPLKPGWLKAISEEYLKRGKPFLLSGDTYPPHDLVGGIGIYSPETHWLIPDYFPVAGWDLWMLKHLNSLIAFTPLIQHAYGTYDHTGHCRPHVFPADAHLIRKDALVYHRDKFHGLIDNATAEKNVFCHSGDLGDIIASLPVIRQLGGGHLVISDHHLTKEQPALRAMKPRMHLIEELLASQHYVLSVKFSEKPEGITHDFRPFRRKYRPDRTLTESQADWVGVRNVVMDPWLTVKPDSAMSGRIVVARSARYRNPLFPWAKLVAAAGKRMVFVGVEDEHNDFCQHFGRIDWHRTNTLMDAAAAIAGSSGFIGNQSSPCWLAMGIGAPMVQETHVSIHDSRVPRKNAAYVHNGVMPGPLHIA